MTDSTVSWSNADDTKGMETLDFVASRPGRRDVTGAIWLPKEAGSPDLPLVVFGHGASGDRYQNPIPELAQRFATELGCPSLAMDGPVHGLRRVEPGGREALAVERQRPTSTAEMVEEWHFAIDLAFGHSAIGPRPLAYFGLSMGSANLILVGVILLGLTVAFQLVTLPVEFNASSRAKAVHANTKDSVGAPSETTITGTRPSGRRATPSRNAWRSAAPIGRNGIHRSSGSWMLSSTT